VKGCTLLRGLLTILLSHTPLLSRCLPFGEVCIIRASRRPGTYLASAEGLRGSVRHPSCVDMLVGNKDRYDLHRHCRPTSSLHRTRALQPTERREWRGYRWDGLGLAGGALRIVPESRPRTPYRSRLGATNSALPEPA
jgi:hypothetical protein